VALICREINRAMGMICLYGGMTWSYFQGFRQHASYRKGMSSRERWAMMGKSPSDDLTRQFIEGRRFPTSAGGIEHQVSRWNYSAAEDMRNDRLLDDKWRQWRRAFEAEVERRRPRWQAILEPLRDEPSDFNLTFFDHRGRPFPASRGRSADEVVDGTTVAYLKWRLDRAAHRHRCLWDERDAASASKEDPAVTPWLPRNGYSVRWRHSYGGLVVQPEVKRDGDPTIYGSPEEKQKVLDAQMEALRTKGEPPCWNCDNSDPSQDEAFYLRYATRAQKSPETPVKIPAFFKRKRRTLAESGYARRAHKRALQYRNRKT